MTDASGGLLQKFEYEPFGQETGNATVAYPFLFTGRIAINANILYFRTRFYDSSTGTFLSEDPLDSAGSGSNLYRYVGNDPASFTDPLGLVDPAHVAEIGAISGVGTAAVGVVGVVLTATPPIGWAILGTVVAGLVIGGAVGALWEGLDEKWSDEAEEEKTFLQLECETRHNYFLFREALGAKLEYGLVTKDQWWRMLERDELQYGGPIIRPDRDWAAYQAAKKR